MAVASGPTGLRALTVSSSSYTIVVSVAGTSLSTTVDGVGRFKLTGVPSGTVELKFSGNGMQGSIILTGVKDADQVDVAVTLSSTGAALQTQERDTGGEVQLEGRIAALNPGGTANTLLVDSTTVSVPTTAIIRHGDTDIKFSELKVGDRVHVKGTKNGQLLTAREVMVQNDNTTVPVNVTGPVSLLQSGFTCPTIRFTVAGWIVETGAATDFQKGTLREHRERHVGAREGRRPVIGAGPGDVGPGWEVARPAGVGCRHVGLEERPPCVSHSTDWWSGPPPGGPGFFPRGSLP